MKAEQRHLLALTLLSVVGLAVSISQAQKPNTSASIVIPKIWDDEAMTSLEVPLASPSFSPVHISANSYYRIPVRPIYKTYPVYAPDKEPPGYIEWLKQQEPEIAFDAAKLKTEEEWINLRLERWSSMHRSLQRLSFWRAPPGFI